MTQRRNVGGRPRDSRAQVIEEVAAILADAARVLGQHADEVVAWWDRRRAQRNEEGKSNG